LLVNQVQRPGEARAIRTHYESDVEFQRSVNRYVSDFEAMLRREADTGVREGQVVFGAGRGRGPGSVRREDQSP
jgi:hypothetical protein